MLMKSSISFSKKTLFSQSVSSASISSVCRRIESGDRRPSRREPFPQPLFPNVLSLSAAWHLRREPRRRRVGLRSLRPQFHFRRIPAKANDIRTSCAVPRQFFPEFPVRLFAVPRTSSGSPENRGSRAARPAAPAWSAESCPAVLQDAEAAPLPAIPRAQSWRRSDTWLPPAEKLFYGIVPSCCRERGVTRKLGEEEILRGSRRRRHKLIARDFRGNAQPAVLSGLDPHNLSQAADLYIA